MQNVLEVNIDEKNAVYKTQKVCINIEFLDNIPYFIFTCRTGASIKLNRVRLRRTKCREVIRKCHKLRTEVSFSVSLFMTTRFG